MKKREAQNEKLMYEIAQVGYLAVISSGLRRGPQLRHSAWGCSYALLRSIGYGSSRTVG